MLSCLLLALFAAGEDFEVVVVLGTECPLAKLYVSRLNELSQRYPQVRFRGVNASPQDSAAEVAQFARRLNFPYTKDAARARQLGATRSPEAFVLAGGRVVYQGRIDDQYTPGTNRSQPTRRDLEEALKELLAGKTVSVPVTAAAGCLLDLDAPAAGGITFEQAGPILHRKCAPCHRPGQVAPFSLLHYDDTVGWGPMMREVIASRRMPPWHADPRHGKFANDRSLTAEERVALLGWLDAGAPRGKRDPVPPTFKDGWEIRADLVLTMDQPFAVPAEGVLDYQEFRLSTGLPRDTWIQAVQVRAGNAAVVHHIIAYLRPPGGKPHTIYVTEANDYCLSGLVPGSTAEVWPAGIAKLIPAGWDIVLSVHYQPNGMPQTDRSSIGLELADPATVRQRAVTRVLLKPDLVLPPNRVTEVRSSWTLEEDLTLYALSPHMHLRGKSMRFEADGEVLLDVPHFDINWQHNYVLAQPRRLPKGTTISCIGRLDNTAGNPNNPDPRQTVRWGEQTTDEMFQGTFLVVRTHENRLAWDWGLPLMATSGLLLVAFITWRRLVWR